MGACAGRLHKGRAGGAAAPTERGAGEARPPSLLPAAPPPAGMAERASRRALGQRSGCAAGR
eukprot:scaffold870_cov393-Prasinococcus_capsulatus_cf.AAC.34